MIKVVAPAQHHPTNRTLYEFHDYWGESHGPLFANTQGLRRYVQHLTLHEAYGIEPAPNFDGVLMVVRASFTSARLSKNALNMLYQRQVNVLGLILNCIDAEMPDYYYYRYPKYYAAS